MDYGGNRLLIEADASGLELVGAGCLSQDKVLCKEIREEVNIHGDNQSRFKLPERVHAKVFVFRLLYGGTCWAYAKDSLFKHISDNPEYWQGIIDEFYRKYTGIAEWHSLIYQQAIRDGRLIMPTGRVYTFSPYLSESGELKWPRTTILNYPIQGLGADLMAIARVVARKRLAKIPNLVIINSVHDSILVDTIKKNVYTVVKILDQVFKDIPMNFEKLFKVKFNLPMRAEIKTGMDWLHMEKVIL